jgi:hypothetical protein
MGCELCLSSAYYLAGKGNPDCISQGLYDLVGYLAAVATQLQKRLRSLTGSHRLLD